MRTATKTKRKKKNKAKQKQTNKNIKEQRLKTNVVELYIFPKSCGEW